VESVLHSFQNDGQDGFNPQAGLIFDAAGNLCGTTFDGGGYDGGTVFKLKHGTWTEKVLYSFTGGTDGGFPEAGLILGPAGNLYGTTVGGGGSGCGGTGCGVIFEIRP
jgi:uncharacterized repeat protein (TIGR03803 family)